MTQLKGYKINNEFFDNPVDLGGIILIQAGRYCCAAGTLVPEHFHDNYFELTVVNDGKGFVITNDEYIPVKQNDIYVSFPLDRHAIISDKEDPIQYDHLAFIVEKEGLRESMLEIAAEYSDPAARIISDRRINYFTYCLVSEFNKKQKFYKDAILYMFYNIVIYAIRKFKEKDISAFAENASESEKFCNCLMTYIDENIYEVSNLNDLIKLTNYNYNYISALFKKTTGTTLRDYYINRKLETANILVKEGKLKIYQIAEKLHYSTADAFTRAYKKKYGVSPKAGKN